MNKAKVIHKCNKIVITIWKAFSVFFQRQNVCKRQYKYNVKYGNKSYHRQKVADNSYQKRHYNFSKLKQKSKNFSELKNVTYELIIAS